MYRKHFLRFFIVCLGFAMLMMTACNSQGQPKSEPEAEDQSLVLGAEQFEAYLPKLEGKNVGMVVNHTATVGNTHLVDTLKSLGINIKAVFAPEHGFRGEADAGAKIEDGIDLKTGVEIRSLYGANRKPTPEMISDLDIIVFDIQDVGARFYTFISTMHHTMEAAAENDLEYLVLDRPNPNGSYVDGPIRDEELKSFVGMHPIPIVHGLTVGELAGMINGEGWLEDSIQCKLSVIQMKGYTHEDEYILPIKPSPNLPDQASIIMYPSLCLFEGTVISEGRGTYQAFSQVGHPAYEGVYDHTFTPVSIPGMSTHPKLQDQLCYGITFQDKELKREFSLKYLIDFYNNFPDKDNFFNRGIDRLAGYRGLKEQIKQGMSEEEIRATWEPALNEFKQKRKNYLLYPENRD